MNCIDIFIIRGEITMKRKLLLCFTFLLICIMLTSLSACTDPDQPSTSNPNTDQPQTSVDTSGDDLKTSEPNTAQPQTADVQRPIIDEVTQENVSEVFMPSLECYVCYLGSYLYEVEKDEDGELVSYGMSWHKVLGYNDFESLRADMSKYLSDSVIDEVVSIGAYRELDGYLFIQDPQRGGNGPFDITSIKLLDSGGDTYTISVDQGWFQGGDAILYIDRIIFTTTLKDGVLFIESVEKGPDYTADELRAATPAEDRLWIGEYYKILDGEPVSYPFNEDTVFYEG